MRALYPEMRRCYVRLAIDRGRHRPRSHDDVRQEVGRPVSLEQLISDQKPVTSGSRDTSDSFVAPKLEIQDAEEQAKAY